LAIRRKKVYDKYVGNDDDDDDEVGVAGNDHRVPRRLDH